MKKNVKKLTKDFGNEQNVRFAVCYEDENGEEMYASLPMRSDIETKSAAQDYFEKWMRKHGEKYSRIKWVEYFKGYKPYDMILDKKAKDAIFEVCFDDYLGNYRKVLYAVGTAEAARKKAEQRYSIYKLNYIKKVRDSKKTRDIPVGEPPKVENRRIITWKTIKTSELKDLLNKYKTSIDKNDKRDLKTRIHQRMIEIRNDFQADLKSKDVTEAEVKNHYAKEYNSIITKINQELNENYARF